MNIENEDTEDLVEVEEVSEDEQEEEQEEVIERQKESLEDRAKRLERQLNQTRKKLGKDVSTPKAKQSDDFDYGEYAYLAQKGIESDDDIKFVKDSMKDSGKNLREVLGANWFKAELEERKALSKTTNAIPRGRNANSTAVDSVEYWLGKPIEEVPQEMRVKVVNARLAKENSGGKFYNS